MMTRTRFYVGMVTRDGAQVTPRQRAECERLVAGAYGDGATLYDAVGYWQGTREPSLVLEVLSADVDAPDPASVAGVLARVADQSAVLWTTEAVEGGFAS